MNDFGKYCQKIREEEVKALKGYGDFLSVFYNNINNGDLLENYSRLEEEWINRLMKIRKVIISLGIETDSEEKERLLANSRITLKKITDSLDRMGGALHDEISSLNKKNNRMGLRYNRYDNRSANPGIIDITT